MCEKKGGKRRRREEEEGRRRGCFSLSGCCLVVFRSTCMCAVATHRRIRHQAGGAIAMAITHPPFASFSRAAPHSPPTSLGAAASALRLSPCLSVFLFRGATFLKFQLAFLFSSALIRTGGTGARGSPETPGWWARWARPGPAARWSAPPPQSSLGRSRRTGVLVAVLASPALQNHLVRVCVWRVSAYIHQHVPKMEHSRSPRSRTVR